MGNTTATDKKHRTRSDVRRDYGYPWPWHQQDILETEFVEEDRDINEIARRFACDPETVGVWLRKHGIAGEGSA